MLAAIVSVSGLVLSDEEKSFLERYNPMGVSLFSRNIKGKEQLINLINDIKQHIGRNDVVIAVDQEGGRVRRLTEPYFAAAASQYVLGQLPAEVSGMHAEIISQDLRSSGINVNYAPVLDVVYPSTHPVLVSRCFSSDEKIVAELGAVMIEEYIKCGICPCIKHMPGHGRAETDPHLGLPVLTNSLKDLEKDFYPFIKNNKTPMGMTAHIAVTEIDDKLPVTMSKKAIDKIIRGIIGFDGMLISDAIDMKALRGNIAERAKAALNAGCDVICYCGGKIDELHSLAENCPNVSDKSMNRFEKIKNIIKLEKTDLRHDITQYGFYVGKVDEYKETYDATEVLNNINKKGV